MRVKLSGNLSQDRDILTLLPGTGITLSKAEAEDPVDDIEVSMSAMPRPQAALVARGLISEDFPLFVVGSSTTIATQVVYGFALGLNKGDVVSNLVVAINAGAAGTSPVVARFGLANSGGVMVATSVDIGAAANWAAGQRAFALSPAYTVPVDGGYFACLLVNGTWGSSQPALGRTQPQNTYGAYGANMPYQFQWSGQTDLPTVGNPLTTSTPAGTGYWIAAA